jgi:acyl transferase domain-containing protein
MDLGRMLAVGMSESAAKTFLLGIPYQHTMEIACINSPESVVLAGSEADLKAAQNLLPTGAFSSFIPGNIAFHCSLTRPIIKSLSKRLSGVIKATAIHASVPLISTVSGKVHEGPVGPAYWVDNVRQPVRFKQVREMNMRSSTA